MKSKKLTKRLLAAFLALFIFGQVFAVSASAASADPRTTIEANINGDQDWKNGSTREYVYSTIRDCQNGTNSIGSLNPYEQAFLVGYYAGYYIVEYTVDSAGGLKVGFVKYNGGIKDPYWAPSAYTAHGKTPVYKSTNDAEAGTNSIGYLNANENCTYVFQTGPFKIVLYTANGTPKVGYIHE